MNATDPKVIREGMGFVEYELPILLDEKTQQRFIVNPDSGVRLYEKDWGNSHYTIEAVKP